MKRLITNQSSPRARRLTGHFGHTGAAALGMAAVLLFGLTVTGYGQGGAPSVQFRPVKDFIDAQGTLPFVPPWEYSNAWTDPDTKRVTVVDFTGHAGRWVEQMSGGAISPGTEIDGKIIERPLRDGRAEVTVLLHTKNALTWVAELPPENQPPWGPLLFGYDVWEVLAGAPPALGDSFFKWMFINSAPGAELPDLIRQFVYGPTVETLMLSFEASADGVLRDALGVPEGTPGMMQVTQAAPFRRPGVGLGVAGWPAEHIKLRVVGR